MTKARKVDLFPTSIFVDQLDLDTSRIESRIRECQSKYAPVSSGAANVNGYQGDNDGNGFYDEILFQKITDTINSLVDLQDRDLKYWAWININPQGSFNIRHSHTNTNFIMCGVYYVKCNEDSGKIRFWDPRGHYPSMMNDPWSGSQVHIHHPKTNEVILFPNWIEHDVSPNMSTEDRISIAFNVKFLLPK